jgi:hypothetical protein
VNDQLHLRPPSLVDVKSMSTGNVTSPPTSPQQIHQVQQLGGNMSVEQQLAVKQLCNDTRMIPEYSLQCLNQAQWNYQQALRLAQENRHKLPPNAFTQ